MFGSRSVGFHILRGILGLGFLAMAIQYSPVWGWWTLLPAAAALTCLGGCPMCWTVGLIATVLQRKSNTACVDGSCGGTKSVSGIDTASMN